MSHTVFCSRTFYCDDLSVLYQPHMVIILDSCAYVKETRFLKKNKFNMTTESDVNKCLKEIKLKNFAPHA